MTKTIDGKYIFTHKGEDYVPLEDYTKLFEKNQDLQEKVILLRASEPMLELEKYYNERDKYKEVIEEVRKYVEDYMYYTLADGNTDDYVIEDAQKELLQILDKAKENK